ncbi:transposase [Thomasclavelia sp.]
MQYPTFILLNKKTQRFYDIIMTTVKHQLSNTKIESINNKIKVLIRKSYKFRNIHIPRLN